MRTRLQAAQMALNLYAFMFTVVLHPFLVSTDLPGLHGLVLAVYSLQKFAPLPPASDAVHTGPYVCTRNFFQELHLTSDVNVSIG